ncbi:hypothetical protein QFC19_005368 [Naganishia cerealis]|uniref:Uncharacterized protein n=1 Tax=Naganishia cerealis TaxID=610337 RepID=A0ACC2VNU9_9TREE|nr:hypothetical protein QFC19_005368 [Naganishia cerealis]
MSAPSSDPPSQPPTEGTNEKHETTATSAAAPPTDAAPPSTDDVEMKQAEEKVDRFEDVPSHVLEMSPEDIRMQIRLIDSECREQLRLMHEHNTMMEQITDNAQKIKQNKVLPYLVGNVVEILDMENEGEEEGAVKNEQNAKKGKCAVIKTSSRQASFGFFSHRRTVFLPMIGLVPAEELKPGDLIGVNKDSFLVLDTLPAEYDSRVKAMEVDEKPTDTYADIGGLDKQIEELVEAIVLPMQQADKFKKLGIKPPKGALMYGPPGTGKTLLARACAAQTNACYLKLAGPSLVQMFIGDGAKLVRDAFELAKEKAPAIIFIDELDAIGTKRFDSDKSGDREVQRTMLELLNQLDGFSSDERIKVIAATNRIDILDPALLRSGRLDRKIEFPLPNEEARARIMQIHARKMTVSPKVNFEELARSTDEFNGAQLKAVCVEAGMIALREGAKELNHEHFHGGIMEVAAKKKSDHFGVISIECAVLIIGNTDMQRIRTEEDVHLWKNTPGYRAFVAWIQRRAERIVGKEMVQGDAAQQGCSERIHKILLLLNVMEQWSDEVELYPETQRYGNRAFREYIKLVEDRLPTALPTPSEVTAEVLPLLLKSHAFGHPVRLDYGSGHELSFVLSLFVMVQMGYVGHLRKDEGEAEGQPVDGDAEEDDLVLRVFPRGLGLHEQIPLLGDGLAEKISVGTSRFTWCLGTRRLLFLAVPLGIRSATRQVLYFPHSPPSSSTAFPGNILMLRHGVPGLGTDVTPPQALEQARAAAKDPTIVVKDLWTISLCRIFEFKTGPFFEHSPLLNSLSTTMPNFRKIHKGLLKMYTEEVLGKRVVVQHLFLSEITWGPNIRSGQSVDLGVESGRRDGVLVADTGMESTRAPWAR